MKLEQITTELQQQQADAAWITTPLNIFYFTGYLSDPHERLLALLIKNNGEQILFCPQLEVDEVKNSPFEGEIIGYLDTENALDKHQATYNKLLIEAHHLTVHRQRELIDAFNVNQFGDIDQTIKALRNVKSESEITKIKKLVNLQISVLKLA